MTKVNQNKRGVIAAISAFLVITVLISLISKWGTLPEKRSLPNEGRAFVRSIGSEIQVSDGNGRMILTISGIPKEYHSEIDRTEIVKAEIIGPIKIENVDLSRSDRHFRIVIGNKSFWILFFKYLDKYGNRVDRVEYDDGVQHP